MGNLRRFFGLGGSGCRVLTILAQAADVFTQPPWWWTVRVPGKSDNRRLAKETSSCPTNVTFAGPDTCVAESLDGPFRDFRSARAAAAQHLDKLLADCRETLTTLRRAGSYCESRWLLEKQ